MYTFVLRPNIYLDQNSSKGLNQDIKLSRRNKIAGCLVFLGATRSIQPISHGNVAGWVAGWLAVCHSRYCIKTTKPILKLFRPFDHLHGSPIIEAFRTPCADSKFQGEPLHRGLYIHGGSKNWRFSTEMADISKTVQDTPMVTMERWTDPNPGFKVVWVVLWSARRRGQSSMSLPIFKQIAQFVQSYKESKKFEI